MTVSDPSTLSVRSAIDHMEAGDLSASELMEALLARINERDATVHAWAYIDVDAARAQAQTKDSGPRTGALHGIPIGLKDIIETADMPTEYGSPIYGGHRPAKDATVTARLKAAGAIILGKTVSTEFASRTPGPTTNPHNSAHSPGGSSSGSAAAVADFQVPAALGTQTLGSVLRPASFCGVLGYKPAFDQFPVTGVYPYAPSFDTVGVFARNLGDLPVLSAVLSGRPVPADGPLAIIEPSSPPRFALTRTQYWDEADEDAKARLESFANDLAQTGGRVRAFDMPEGFGEMDQALHTIEAAEAAATHAIHWRDHRAQLSKYFQGKIEAGLRVDEVTLAGARETVQKWRAAFPTFLEPGELVLTLSSTGEAPLGLESTGDPVFNQLWTALHYPALSLPAGTGKTGLPLGIQLVSPDGNETHLFAAARWSAAALDLPVM